MIALLLDNRGVSRVKTMSARFMMKRWIWLAFLGIVSVLSGSGCDSTTFVAPPPAELAEPEPANGAAGSRSAVLPRLPSNTSAPVSNTAEVDGRRSTGGGPRVAELILAKPPNPDRIYLTSALRRDAGRAKMLIRISQPAPGESSSPERLAKAISLATVRGSAALIIEPIDDPAVLDQIDEAQSKGLAILLLDRPLRPRGGKSIPVLRYESFEKLGRQIVQTALDAATRADRLGHGRIVVLQNRTSDPYSAERLASLTDALKAAGQPYEILAFQGEAAAATAALRPLLTAASGVALVLAEEDQGLTGSRHLLAPPGTTADPEFVLAGYGSYDLFQSDYVVLNCSGYGDRCVGQYAKSVFNTVRGLIEGKPVGDRIEVATLFYPPKMIDAPSALPRGAPPRAKRAGQ
jgi:hypothetical protein